MAHRTSKRLKALARRAAPLFVEVTQSSGTYRVQIKLVDGTNLLVGERTLSVKSDDCGTVVDTMGPTVSLTIDPSSVIEK